ncbi:MAG: hypothetical protein HQL39_05855 [Alphaproteobacteria bacterium]|nr:hypothetical protein [Alphaproteobacteria bacterium]
MGLTPFEYITGPFYVYVISKWIGSNMEPIYVGRGKGFRAKAYYKLGQGKGRPSKNKFKARNAAKYLEPETHNDELNKVIAQIRRKGMEVFILAHDCFSSKEQAQLLEKALIRQYGRRNLSTGTLLNRNNGG